MIVRDTSLLQEKAIAEGFLVREVVSKSEVEGYLVTDAKVRSGSKKEQLRNLQGDEWNHIYYCVNGSVEITSDGNCYKLDTDCVLAVPAALDAGLEALEDSWLMITYSKSTNCENIPKKPLFTKLGDIVGGERDVDWTRGHSRRFLLARDGFGITLTNTLAYPNNDCQMEYKNHIESAYWIDGAGKYEWDDGKSSKEINMKREGEAICFTMNKHDKHHAYFTGNRNYIAICVFCPALVGNETHKFDGKGSSSY